ncbi:hypothetical protein ACFP65_00165 [Marinilactibacillus sp. GCM10026970]|uniref:hypothetical protein n=1 Tax=Marinilactibacillus sp. GCM10026970 TaxID=3252642 RepID=UPI003607A10E
MQDSFEEENEKQLQKGKGYSCFGVFSLLFIIVIILILGSIGFLLYSFVNTP